MQVQNRILLLCKMKWLVVKFYIFTNFVILGTTGQNPVDKDDGKFDLDLALLPEVVHVKSGGEAKVGCSTRQPVDPTLYTLQSLEWWFDGNTATFKNLSTSQKSAKKQILVLNTTYKYTRREGERELRLVCRCFYKSTLCGTKYSYVRVIESTSSAADVTTPAGRATQNERQRRVEMATIAKVKYRRRQVLSLVAVAVCAVGLIASVLWGKTSKGPVSWFRPCERIRFLRLHSTGGDSRKASQDSGIVGPRHTMPRITVDEAGDSSCDTSTSSSPGSSTGTSSRSGLHPSPELVYAELMHVAPSVVFVPRPDASEYVEIVGIQKDNQI